MKCPPLLRKCQEKLTDNIISNIQHRPLAVLPTGGGKTLCIAEVARRMNLSVLGVSHRKELNDQMRRHFDAIGLYDAEVFSVQKHRHPETQLVIIDEAHHATAKSYQKFKNYPYMVGFTATPLRLDGRGLGSMFGKLIIGATPRELVADGYLYAPDIYTHYNPDMTGVTRRGGDFVAVEAQERMLKADILNTYKKHGCPSPAIGYATSIEHSKQLTDEFNTAGISAAHVDGNTKERDNIFFGLRDGAYNIVWNVGIVTEGFDIPYLECAILARPTDSLCMYLQMIGRVMRPEGGCLILDHAGNALRHGSPLQDIEYTLDATVRRQGQPLGLRMCTGCFLMVPVGTMECPECSQDLSPATRARIKLEAGELVKFQEREEVWEQDKDKYRELFGEPLIIDDELMLPTEENKKTIFSHYRKEYGMDEGAHRYKDLYGKWPRAYCVYFKNVYGRYPV